MGDGIGVISASDSFGGNEVLNVLKHQDFSGFPAKKTDQPEMIPASPFLVGCPLYTPVTAI